MIGVLIRLISLISWIRVNVIAAVMIYLHAGWFCFAILFTYCSLIAHCNDCLLLSCLQVMFESVVRRAIFHLFSGLLSVGLHLSFIALFRCQFVLFRVEGGWFCFAILFTYCSLITHCNDCLLLSCLQVNWLSLLFVERFSICFLDCYQLGYICHSLRCFAVKLFYFVTKEVVLCDSAHRNDCVLFSCRRV